VYAQDAIVQAPNILCLEARDAAFRGEREEKERLPTKTGAFENLTSEQIGEGIAAEEARGRGQTKDGDEYAGTGERDGVSDCERGGWGAERERERERGDGDEYVSTGVCVCGVCVRMGMCVKLICGVCVHRIHTHTHTHPPTHTHHIDRRD